MELQEKNILDYLQRHEEEIYADLEGYVRAESPSDNKELADKCADFIEDLFKKRLGLTGERFYQEGYGDQLTFVWGDQPEQNLVLCHYDTVWAPGRLPTYKEGNQFHGPGILDMKGGLIIAIWAVKVLGELGIPLNRRVRFLCNSDEEIENPSSLPYIEKYARESKAVLCLEPPEAVTGYLKTARKGVGRYKVYITGRAAHAGNHHEDGISAAEEAARQTVFIHSLTDYSKGTTLNVGCITAGERANVVAESALLEIDLRVTNMEEARRVDTILKNLKPILPGIQLRVEGEVGRPPMEQTPGNKELFEICVQAGKALDQEVRGVAVGGGSDGSYTSAMGIPTLDGLGAVGKGIHAPDEHIQMDRFLPRIALVASVLTRI